jgi:hypothetical protein
LYIEKLTLKHTVELFQYLEKNKLNCNSITISFYDKIRYQYITFSSSSDLISFYSTNYRKIPKCKVGDFIRLEKFKSESKLYNFKSNYIIYDIAKEPKVLLGKDSDINRNIDREAYIKKQKEVITTALSKYSITINSLYSMFKTGIYSPCYAEPGWSEGTSIWP